jgi:small conductance mechanosensitive channel
MRQVQVEVRVAYDTDLNQALATIRELLQANPRVLKEPAPLTQVVQPAVSGASVTSTRRLAARPCSVALLAIG